MMIKEVMRITVEIEDKIIRDAMELTGEKNKSPAIAKAVENYVKRMRAKEFGQKLLEGYFDYPMTNEELEAMGVD
jgi:metal-responsive CopG/Arc/MetJ family transcriptional regulator